jgi:NADH-quinone oxidoreductase subunit C
MTAEELKNRMAGLAPEAQVTQGKQYVEVAVPADRLHPLAVTLKNDDDLGFDYLICLTGADFPEHMMLYYHLESTVHKHMIVLKAKIMTRTHPEVESVWDIWRTAEFHECEVFDLLGIRFTNHPDLRRLFLADDWGFPLRKDYVDEVRIVDR